MKPNRVDVGTIAGLLAHRHELHVLCPSCERRSVLGLEAMTREGRGERRLQITVRCEECGEIGTM